MPLSTNNYPLNKELNIDSRTKTNTSSSLRELFQSYIEFVGKWIGLLKMGYIKMKVFGLAQ